MQLRSLRGVATGLALIATAACSPASPSQNQVETLTGSVALKGFGLTDQFFSTSKSGEYSVTLLTLVPAPIGPVTVSLGTVTSGVCGNTGPSNGFATRNAVVLQGAIQRGTFCIFVLDQGTLVADSNFTVSVSHP